MVFVPTMTEIMKASTWMSIGMSVPSGGNWIYIPSSVCGDSISGVAIVGASVQTSRNDSSCSSLEGYSHWLSTHICACCVDAYWLPQVIVINMLVVHF